MADHTARRDRAAHLIARFGGVQALEASWRSRARLTVLSYHRIGADPGPDADYLTDLLSTTPAGFAQQIEWVRRRFSVVGMDDLLAHLRDGCALPPRPLMITFDDGYLDNYQYAAPVLRRLGLPAVIFLVTGAIGQGAHMWWDQLAMMFRRTAVTVAVLPFIGRVPLTTYDQRESALNQVLAALKAVPDDERARALEAVRVALGVEPLAPGSGPPFMDWTQVQELVDAGIDCQPHTVTHPLLTRIDADRLRAELTGSAQEVQRRTGRPTPAFAYPNGTVADIDDAVVQAVGEAGFEMAFTMEVGPALLDEVRARPLLIPRVAVSHTESMEMFQLRVMGLGAVYRRLRDRASRGPGRPRRRGRLSGRRASRVGEGDAR